MHWWGAWRGERLMSGVNPGAAQAHTGVSLDQEMKERLMREIRGVIESKLDLMLEPMLARAIQDRMEKVIKQAKREGSADLALSIMEEVFKKSFGN